MNEILCKKLKIISKKELTNQVFEFTFIADNLCNFNIGQFINLKVCGFYLRRPISVMEYENGKIKICFKILGEGTKRLANLNINDEVDCLYPLGNGFSLEKINSKKILIIGGGIGVPPLVGLYKKLKSDSSLNIKVLLGFKEEHDIIYQQEFKNCEIILDSESGNIIEYMNKNNLFEKYKDYYIFSCGPQALLNELSLNLKYGQMLLEERMGCGFGACMGCSKKINRDEYKRVCVEGPMFYLEEVRYGIEN